MVRFLRAAVTRNTTTTVLEILGAAATVAGVALISVPAAFIVGGAFAIAGAFLADSADE